MCVVWRGGWMVGCMYILCAYMYVYLYSPTPHPLFSAHPTHQHRHQHPHQHTGHRPPPRPRGQPPHARPPRAAPLLPSDGAPRPRRLPTGTRPGSGPVGRWNHGIHVDFRVHPHHHHLRRTMDISFSRVHIRICIRIHMPYQNRWDWERAGVPEALTDELEERRKEKVRWCGLCCWWAV